VLLLLAPFQYVRQRRDLKDVRVSFSDLLRSPSRPDLTADSWLVTCVLRPLETANCMLLRDLYALFPLAARSM
jgi:hypothetical protein